MVYYLPSAFYSAYSLVLGCKQNSKEIGIMTFQ